MKPLNELSPNNVWMESIQGLMASCLTRAISDISRRSLAQIRLLYFTLADEFKFFRLVVRIGRDTAARISIGHFIACVQLPFSLYTKWMECLQYLQHAKPFTDRSYK